MKSKILRSSLLLIFAALIIFGINRLIVFNNVELKAESRELNTHTLEYEMGILAPGEIDPENYTYKVKTSGFEAIEKQPDYPIPKQEGLQIYCIEPGNPINFDYQIRYKDALKLVGEKYQRDCRGEKDNKHAKMPNNGDQTPTYYVSVGDNYVLSNAAAYVVSDSPIGDFSLNKQRALWNLRDETVYNAKTGQNERADGNLIIGSGVSTYDAETTLEKEAVDYAKYDNEVRNKGLNPVDVTNINDIYTKTNQTTGELTIGPFYIEYTNGRYGDVTFSGISNMTVIGQNSNGTVVKNNISVDKIILRDKTTTTWGAAQKPKYFDPDIALKVDRSNQVYPESGQYFQIVIKDPNIGINDINKMVSYITLKIEFKYMLANGEYSMLQGTKYEVAYMHDHEYNPHRHIMNGPYHYGCETTGYLKEFSQQWIIAADAVRTIYTEEMTIGFSKKTTDYLVKKVWDDDKDKKGKRPDLIKVELKTKDGMHVDTVVLSERNYWMYSWENLSADVEYTVEEIDKVSGYETSYVHGENYTVIINELKTVKKNPPHNRPPHDEPPYDEPDTEYTTYTVIKQWYDQNDKYEKRPDSIKVQLMRDNHEHGKPVELNEDNNWTYEWEELPKGYTYSVKEIDAIDGYATSYRYTSKTTTIENSIVEIPITMNLGGHVWEDGTLNKESKPDGRSNSGNTDKPLQNVKVTLYEYDIKTKKSTLAKLLSKSDEEGISNEVLMHRINPTLTDKDGNYLFEGLDTDKKYYVTFEYNGQTYMPTEYLKTENEQYTSVNSMVNAGLYNKEEWKVTSKGTEIQAKNNVSQNTVKNNRTDYDNQFAEIGSYPANYVTTNSLDISNHLTNIDGKYYNATYTKKELMGYTLKYDEKSKKYKYVLENEELQLIDGYLYDENGLETTTWKEGYISKYIKRFIAKYKRYPQSNEIRNIYKDIADNFNKAYGKDITETLRMLQFIEDCKIESYTKSQDTLSKLTELDLYPVYDKFKVNHVIGNEKLETVKEMQEAKYSDKAEVLDGVTYNVIYPGQLFVNQGLWRRQEADVSLRKDVYKTALKINDKTEIYKYDKRLAQDSGEGVNKADGNDNNTYWDINVRLSDANYYGQKYSRQVYKSDYEFKNELATNHGGDPLEVYVTYKIEANNQSQSIMVQIQEIVDYFDKDYEYKDNLSWIQYSSKISDDEYKELMSNEQNAMDTVKATNYMKQTVSYAANGKVYSLNDQATKYKGTVKTEMLKKYNAVYVTGMKDRKLGTGSKAYIYLTFKVRKDNDRIIINTQNDSKQNIAEINGYKTYYPGSQDYKVVLPNGITKTSNDIAGLIDRDSNPGNLLSDNIENMGKAEDDTDKAIGLRIFVENDNPREISGTVWEDKRENVVKDAIIGDGLNKKETAIQGVTVQLVEKYTGNDKKLYEYIWGECNTDKDGKYSFTGYIPGNYIVRFYYGDTEKTVETKINGGENIVSYNGQDFKTTIYQKDIASNEEESKNTTGSYVYNINASEKKDNISDVKDLWSNKREDNYQTTTEIVNGTAINGYYKNILKDGQKASRKDIQGRVEVNNYSNNNSNGVVNHLAEVLASPYSDPMEASRRKEFVKNELIPNTYMTAETGVITVEVEYDRNQTDGGSGTNKNVSGKDIKGDNAINGKYILGGIDLGLVERPKAQLEIDKSIANIKVVLSNGTVIYDVNEAANNVIWVDHKSYDLANKASRSGIVYKKLSDTKKYEDYYGDNKQNRYSYRNEINDIVSITDNGIITLTIDEELMHGATIEVIYKIKVTNVGETDYSDTKFYYLGEEDNAANNIVKTRAMQVVDYVANNFKFDVQNATNRKYGWSVISKEEILAQDLVNSTYKDGIEKYNTIIYTEKLGTELNPGQSEEVELVLSQLITSQNSSDNLTYKNIAEIVKVGNTTTNVKGSVGRRMAFSVVGNQNPADITNPNELDSSSSEEILILPPFGDNKVTYYIIGSIVAIILAGGIILIRKRVLQK